MRLQLGAAHSPLTPPPWFPCRPCTRASLKWPLCSEPCPPVSSACCVQGAVATVRAAPRPGRGRGAPGPRRRDTTPTRRLPSSDTCVSFLGLGPDSASCFESRFPHLEGQGFGSLSAERKGQQRRAPPLPRRKRAGETQSGAPPASPGLQALSGPGAGPSLPRVPKPFAGAGLLLAEPANPGSAASGWAVI